MPRTEAQKRWYEKNRHTPAYIAVKRAINKRFYNRHKLDPVWRTKRAQSQRDAYRRNGRQHPSRLQAQQHYLETKLALQVELGGACVRCGLTDHRLLDFDHIDPLLKVFTISSSLHKTVEELLPEVRKCQLLCPNCHRLKTIEGKDTHMKRLLKSQSG